MIVPQSFPSSACSGDSFLVMWVIKMMARSRLLSQSCFMQLETRLGVASCSNLQLGVYGQVPCPMKSKQSPALLIASKLEEKRLKIVQIK